MHSHTLHVSRTRVISSGPAFSRALSENSHHYAKNSILTIIASLTLIVLGFIIFNLIATPEYLIKKQISVITTDYYENYFYKNASDPSALYHYEEVGLPRITLRQLLLYDDLKHSDKTAELSKYCDLDKTLVKIYPEAPYEKSSYHVDFTYSCKFN